MRGDPALEAKRATELKPQSTDKLRLGTAKLFTDGAIQGFTAKLNEPGYYKTGQYGIRIENLVIVRNSDLEGEGRPMLNFETITMVPISTKLVNVLMMSREEINWLNTYHSKVREKLFPLLDETEKKWLVQATEAIAIN